MVRSLRHPARLSILLLTSLGISLSARAQEIDAAPSAPADTTDSDHALAVWIGHVESDNIARTLAAESGSYDSLGVFTALGHVAPRLETGLDSDLELRTYSQDLIDDEVVGTLNAFADFAIVPDVFTWDLRDSYNQGVRDQFGAIGPNNRESINVISSGPQLDIAVGARSIVEIGGEYSARRYDDAQNVDSDLVAFDLGLFRQSSETARYGIVASSSEIDYTGTGAPPYDIDRVSLRYEKELATGRVIADLGSNEIAVGTLRTSEPMYNFEWSRSLTARSAFGVTATRGFTDAGTLTSATLVNEPIGIGEIVVSPDPLERTSLALSYVLMMPRSDLSVSVSLSDESYPTGGPADNDVTASRISFHHAISARLDFGVAIDQLVRDFESAVPVPEDADKTFSAWLNRSLGRKLNVALAWSRYRRTGSFAFDEDRYELRLSYNAIGSGPAAMRSVGR